MTNCAKEIFKIIEKEKDSKQAKKMSAYMQDKFVFLGIPKPKLTLIVKPFLSDLKKGDFSWDFVNECWNKDYREAQYIGLSYLLQNSKKIMPSDLDKIKKLITTKSWWETVDSLDAVVGEIVQKEPALKQTMLDWSKDENLWLRRVSIDFQQKYKDKTDTELLEKIIVNNFGSDEFFINKSIGWSLRDYSKVNPKWVKSFLEKYQSQMNKLSIKEASKYL